MRNFIVALVSILLVGCTLDQKTKKARYLIPKDYTGWVNITFNDTSAKVNSLSFSDGFVYIIIGDPEAFSVQDDVFEAGLFSEEFYYYNTDSLIILQNLSYPKRNVFFPRTISLKEWDSNGLLKDKKVFTFYVSRELLAVDGLSLDDFPSNPILE